MNRSSKYFVSAIGTDSGKTVVSAVLTEYLKADYWKPVQAGRPTDTARVKALVSNEKTRFFSERYLLESPMSPHAAADIDGISIVESDFELPVTENPYMIVEGAGGLLVPINENFYVANLVKSLGCEMILVINAYLGSINHTLLSLEYIRQSKIPLAGVIWNGDVPSSTREVITHYMKKHQMRTLFDVPKFEDVDAQQIKTFCANLTINEEL